VLATALAAAGCGGDSSSDGALAGFDDSSGAVPGAAELLPADVPVLITINTDFDSEQIQLAGDIVERFPASRDLIDRALADLAGDGVDFDADVRPVLGSEVTIALLDVKPDDPPVALVLQPTDPAKLGELLAENSADDGDDPPAWRVVDGWYVLADDEPTLDALLAGAEQASLAGHERFKEIMESLPGESLARLWLSPVVTGELVAEVAADNPTGIEALEAIAGDGQGGFEGAGVALVAETEGVRMLGLIRTVDANLAASGKAEILDLAPAGAIVYIALRDLRASVEGFLDLALQQDPDTEAQIGQLEGLLGLTIQDDLLPLFENEHAIYLRPGTPIPEISIVLSPDDADAAADLIRRLLALAEIGGLELQSDTVDIDGTEVLKLSAEGLTLNVASIEDRLVLTTTDAGIADFAGSNSLKDDARFSSAADAAGLPDETGGFVYLDLAGVFELAQGDSLLGSQDVIGAIDAEALMNLDPLGTLMVYGTTSADGQRFAGLLTIE
jgi:hypothetical protein